MTQGSAKIALGLCALAVLQVSCTTKALWDATAPEQWVRASPSTIGTNELAARNIDYRLDDADGDIYIPKSQLHKLGDYTIRVLATPVTVTIDAATVAGVITIACGAVLLSNLPSATSSPTDNWGRPLDETTGKPIPISAPIRSSCPWVGNEHPQYTWPDE